MIEDRHRTENWSDDKVEQIFEMHLDELHPVDSIVIRRENTTTKQKRDYLMEVDRKFEASFKDK